MNSLKEKLTFDIIVRRNPDALIINYPHQWGGSFHERRYWQGTINGELEDWDSKQNLIKYAKSNGLSYIKMVK